VTTSAALVTVPVPASVEVTGMLVVDHGASRAIVLISPSDGVDEVPAVGNAIGTAMMPAAATSGVFPITFRNGADRQMRLRSSVSNTTVKVTIRTWRDSRGQEG